MVDCDPRRGHDEQVSSEVVMTCLCWANVIFFLMEPSRRLREVHLSPCYELWRPAPRHSSREMDFKLSTRHSKGHNATLYMSTVNWGWGEENSSFFFNLSRGNRELQRIKAGHGNCLENLAEKQSYIGFQGFQMQHANRLHGYPVNVDQQKLYLKGPNFKKPSIFPFSRHLCKQELKLTE